MTHRKAAIRGRRGARDRVVGRRGKAAQSEDRAGPDAVSLELFADAVCALQNTGRVMTAKYKHQHPCAF